MLRLAALSVLGVMVGASPLNLTGPAGSPGGGALAADQSAAQLPALVALDRPYGFDEAVQKSFVPMFDEEREFAARHDNAKLADFLWRRPDAESHVQFGEANAQPLTGDIMGRIYYVNPRIRAF